MLADSTVLAGIRAFNLANPPAGAFAWASEPVERGGESLLSALLHQSGCRPRTCSPSRRPWWSDASVTSGQGRIRGTPFPGGCEGRESLANLSSANAGNRVAIKMNGQVYVTLNIQGRIPDGRIEIPGGDTLEEARALAAILESESPPVAVTLMGQETGDTFTPGEADIVDGAVGAVLVSMGFLGALFLIRYRAAGALFIVGICYHMIMTGAVLRLWNIAGIAPYFTLAGSVGLLCAVLVFTTIHLWIYEYLRAESNTESQVRQVVTVALEKIKPVVVWTHVMLLLVSVSLVVVGTDGVVNFGLVLFSGTAGSLLTCYLWTNMLLSSLVADWQITKLSV